MDSGIDISIEPPDLTPEQAEAMQKILKTVEESRTKYMSCLICGDQTFDRGLVCFGPAPASVILYGLCYPCKNLPNFEDPIRERVQEFLDNRGKGDFK